MLTATSASISTPVRGDPGRGHDADSRIVGEIERNLDRVQPQRVAQRDQIAGALGGHDPGQACHFQYVPFCQLSIADQRQRGRRHADLATGACQSRGHRLLAYVDHPAGAVRIEMAEFAHGSVESKRLACGGNAGVIVKHGRRASSASAQRRIPHGIGRRRDGSPRRGEPYSRKRGQCWVRETQLCPKPSRSAASNVSEPSRGSTATG